MKKYILFGATMLMLLSCGDDKVEDEVIEDEVEDPKVETKVETVNQVVKEAGDLKIGFFYADKVQENYVYAQNETKKLERELESMQKSLMGKKKRFEDWAMDISDRAQRGLLTSTEQNQAQIESQKKQEELMQADQNMQYKAQELQMKLSEDLAVKVRRYVRKYAEENGYDFIMSRQTFDVAYYKDSYDLTKAITDGLNAEEAN